MSRPNTSREIRQAFLDYFKGKGHEALPSGPIVPPNDPTLMFASAGMVQFKDLFTGKEKRAYKRATTSQKCIRISGKHNDLENVGVTARHHTFFEMLGNFSFGDYFKKEAIAFAWEFLTGVLQIPKTKLVITVFGGENGIPADDEAAAMWHEVTGFGNERIIRMGAKDNFWQAGDTGPCGPCSEIHYFHGDGETDLSTFDQEPGVDGTGWTEIWNLVFMQYERFDGGRLEKLPAPSIDTGMGLERITAVVQGVRSNYDTDLLRPVVDLAATISGKKYNGGLSADEVSMRVIADHARAAGFLIAAGIFPDRDGRSYVLRRVMRRAIRHGHRLGIEKLFFHECVLKVVESMGASYPELVERRAMIEEVTKQEEERFRRTMRRGLDLLESAEFKTSDGKKTLPGETAFLLYDTYGFPLDLQEVIGQEQGFAIDVAGFETAMDRARERSAGSKVGEKGVDNLYREIASSTAPTKFTGYECEKGESKVTALVTAGARVEKLVAGQRGELVVAVTPFYAESGGQVGDHGEIRSKHGVFLVEDTQKPVDGVVVHRGLVREGELANGADVTLEVDHSLRAATRRNHSATHLLHYALRTVLGPQAMQKGSLVGPDRLRFDYSSGRPLEREEILRIEDLVNEKILANAEITTDVLPMDDAKKRGAIGIFEEKYGEVVRMLTMTPDSIELCGGTHAARTGDLGLFKIVSEGGVAAGVRRIEGATGTNALRFVREVERELSRTAELVKAQPKEAHDKVEKLVTQHKELQREYEQLKKQFMSGGGGGDTSANLKRVGDVNVLAAKVDLADAGALRELADQLRDKNAPSVIALGAVAKDGSVLLVCTVSKDLLTRFAAGKIIKDVAAVVGGKGGGRPDFAQAGGTDASKLDEALALVYEIVAK
ncbi:MAG: alanine--tRNA ligase [Sandaracinaceae bacterium]|jgi:alanyl-tRNA synthetase|nr:alanine--tRNA ligase [Sandaracinaceae bacterium]